MPLLLISLLLLCTCPPPAAVGAVLWLADGVSLSARTISARCSTKALAAYALVDGASAITVSFDSHWALSGAGFAGCVVFEVAQDGQLRRVDALEPAGHGTTARRVHGRHRRLLLAFMCQDYHGMARFDNVMVREEEDDGAECEREEREGEERGGGEREVKVKVEERRWGNEEDHGGEVWMVAHCSMDRVEEMARALLGWGKGRGRGKRLASVAVWAEEEVEAAEAAKWLVERVRGWFVQERDGLRIAVVSGGRRYPVNKMRNEAWARVPEEGRVLMVDADLVTCGDIWTSYRIARTRFTEEKVAFVLPVFEVESERKQKAVCSTKERLERAFKKGDAWKFKGTHQPRAYGQCLYEKWFKTDQAYAVDYAEQFEPYLVLNANTPIRFDERFEGYGWNKASFVMELHLAGYSFVVLPGAWLVHIQHPKSQESQLFSYDLHVRAKNRLQRLLWMRDIEQRYGKVW